MHTFRNKQTDMSAAIRDIRSGASMFVGGFGGSGIPAELLRALCEDTDVGDLTLINNNPGAGDPNFLRLVDAGRVRRILCSYPRMPGSETIRRQVEAGKLAVEVMPQGTFVERMRAAGAGLGPFFTPTGYGTAFARDKECRVINGRGYVLEQPLHADFAFVKACTADYSGNLVYRYAQRNFGPVMCMAAGVTLVEVESLVPVGELDPVDVVTPGILVDRLVRI